MTFDFEEAFRGGINYIQNSCGLNGLSDDWETDGTVVTLQNDDTKNSTVSNSCFRLSVDSSLSQTLDNIIPGHFVHALLAVLAIDVGAFAVLLRRDEGVLGAATNAFILHGLLLPHSSTYPS